MNSLLRQFGTRLSLATSCSRTLSPPIAAVVSSALLHTCNTPLFTKWNTHNVGPQRWLQQNKEVHPPQLDANEKPRKAYVCHMRTNIKYSPDKMWYIASLVRGMSVDEAIRQLNFVLKKGATHVKEVIREAQQMAVDQHNVEFRSNLWVSESFVGKGRYFRGVRRHARGRYGRVEYKHCHYFVRLEEGEPPKDYYLPAPQSPQEQFDNWLAAMRKRRVINSL